jgi:hypothetical protein
VPGAIGEAPQIDAVRHVRPDFGKGHEEATPGGAGLRGHVQLGLVPGGEIERWVAYPAGDELGEPGSGAGVLNGAVEVLLELVEEVRVLDLLPETAPAGDTQRSPSRIEGLVVIGDGGAVLGPRAPATTGG